MPTANDFGNEVIPGAKDAGYKVQAYAFQGYWEDIGTIEAFYNANLALVDPDKPNFSFYDREAPIYTMSRFLPPSKIVDAEIENCIIGDGSLIKAGSKVTRSVVGLRSLINEDCTVADTMLMGSDYYETLDECEFVPGCLPMGIGAVSGALLLFAGSCFCGGVSRGTFLWRAPHTPELALGARPLYSRQTQQQQNTKQIPNQPTK